MLLSDGNEKSVRTIDAINKAEISIRNGFFITEKNSVFIFFLPILFLIMGLFRNG